MSQSCTAQGPVRIQNEIGDAPPAPPVLSPKESGEIARFALYLRREGYRESTIRSAVSTLKAVAKRTDLCDPIKAKDYLSRAEMTEGRKEVVSTHLANFYRFHKTPFEKPRYTPIEKLPFIPLESEIDALIAGVGRKTATFLQLLKETGMRPGEAWRLKWSDIDFQSKTVTVTPTRTRARKRAKNIFPLHF